MPHQRCGQVGIGCTGDVGCPCACAICRQSVGREIRELVSKVNSLEERLAAVEDAKKDQVTKEELAEALKNSGGGGSGRVI